MKDIDHMIAVLQAFKQGKAIQFRRRSHPDTDVYWKDTPKPCWDWDTFDYRVKPAEPRRVWLNFYPTMGGRSSVCYDSREEAAKFACYEDSQQVEFVEVRK